MKKIILSQLLFLCLVIMFVAFSGSVFAQPGIPCPEGCTGANCEFCVEPSTIPLDSGVGFILVLGLVLGFIKIYQIKSKLIGSSSK
jgi:hypothetical protein